MEKDSRNRQEFRLSDSEYRLMDIVWETEPVNSTELVKEAFGRLGWKKSTTYTVLKKLAEKEVLQNEDAIVRALVKKEQVVRYESEQLLNKSFAGSLPDFMAAFLKDRKLTQAEAVRLKQLIEDAVE